MAREVRPIRPRAEGSKESAIDLLLYDHQKYVLVPVVFDVPVVPNGNGESRVDLSKARVPLSKPFNGRLNSQCAGETDRNNDFGKECSRSNMKQVTTNLDEKSQEGKVLKTGTSLLPAESMNEQRTDPWGFACKDILIHSEKDNLHSSEGRSHEGQQNIPMGWPVLNLSSHQVSQETHVNAYSNTILVGADRLSSADFREYLHTSFEPSQKCTTNMFLSSPPYSLTTKGTNKDVPMSQTSFVPTHRINQRPPLADRREARMNLFNRDWPIVNPWTRLSSQDVKSGKVVKPVSLKPPPQSLFELHMRLMKGKPIGRRRLTERKYTQRNRPSAFRILKKARRFGLCGSFGIIRTLQVPTLYNNKDSKSSCIPLENIAVSHKSATLTDNRDSFVGTLGRVSLQGSTTSDDTYCCPLRSSKIRPNDAPNFWKDIESSNRHSQRNRSSDQKEDNKDKTLSETRHPLSLPLKVLGLFEGQDLTPTKLIPLATGLRETDDKALMRDLYAKRPDCSFIDVETLDAAELSMNTELKPNQEHENLCIDSSSSHPVVTKNSQNHDGAISSQNLYSQERSIPLMSSGVNSTSRNPNECPKGDDTSIQSMSGVEALGNLPFSSKSSNLDPCKSGDVYTSASRDSGITFDISFTTSHCGVSNGIMLVKDARHEGTNEENSTLRHANSDDNTEATGNLKIELLKDRQTKEPDNSKRIEETVTYTMKKKGMPNLESLSTELIEIFSEEDENLTEMAASFKSARQNFPGEKTRACNPGISPNSRAQATTNNYNIRKGIACHGDTLPFQQTNRSDYNNKEPVLSHCSGVESGSSEAINACTVKRPGLINVDLKDKKNPLRSHSLRDDIQCLEFGMRGCKTQHNKTLSSRAPIYGLVERKLLSGISNNAKTKNHCIYTRSRRRSNKKRLSISTNSIQQNGTETTNNNSSAPTNKGESQDTLRGFAASRRKEKLCSTTSSIVALNSLPSTHEHSPNTNPLIKSVSVSDINGNLIGTLNNCSSVPKLSSITRFTPPYSTPSWFLIPPNEYRDYHKRFPNKGAVVTSQTTTSSSSRQPDVISKPTKDCCSSTTCECIRCTMCGRFFANSFNAFKHFQKGCFGGRV